MVEVAKQLRGGVYTCFYSDPLTTAIEAVIEGMLKCDGAFPREIRLCARQWAVLFRVMAQESKCGCCMHRTRDLFVLDVPVRIDRECCPSSMVVVCHDGSLIEALIP